MRTGTYRKNEIEKLKKSIKYLKERAEELREKNMRVAASLYEQKADLFITRLRRWYSVKY